MLYSPLTIKTKTLKNRIVMAPMCMYSSDDSGEVKPFHLRHYGTRAEGGSGLIIIEATAIEKRGRISDKDLGIWSDDHISGLKKLVNVIHAEGALAGIQIAHAGRKCSVISEEIIAPTSLAFSEDYKKPKAIDDKIINELKIAYSEAIRRANEAGFDLIELHGAHGYLINQFLSPLCNHRDDYYGERSNFLKDVLEIVKEQWPEKNLVSLRISAEEYVESGLHPLNHINIINELKDYEIDMIHVSSGGVMPIDYHIYPGYQLEFANTIKKGTGKLVIAGGLITDYRQASEIIENRRADMVFLGRELLRNPYWPLTQANENRIDIRWPNQYERAKKR